MRSSDCLLSSVLACCVACSGTKDRATDADLSAQQTAVGRAALSPEESYSGYVHEIEKSAFDPRDVSDLALVRTPASEARSYVSGSVHRQEGPRGAYFFDTTNNASGAALSADVAGAFKPFGKSVSEHHTKVRNYFVGAGLPDSQIRDVVGGAALIDTGSEQDVDRGFTRVGRFYSIVRRSINGVIVLNSIAVATLADSGKSVHELVYWPALAKEVVDQAADWKRSLTGNAAAAYQAQLPKDIDWSQGDGQVVVIHQSVAWHGTPYTVVAYEVPSMKGDRHFDPAGKEFKTPEELAR